MPDKKKMSFGRYLRAAREERTIGLSAISRQTRIGVDILRAIEDEDHDRLPAEVFVKGFIRAYARTVGADGDIAVDRYLQSRQRLEATARAESDRIRASSRFWPRLLAILGGFVIIVILALVMVSPHDSAPEPAAEPDAVAQPVTPSVPPESQTGAPPAAKPESLPAIPPQRPEVPQTEPVPAPAQAEDAAGTEIPARQPKGRHLLAIEAVEETWMKIIVDNLSAREYTLRPGDRLELEARDSFNLLIGNAGGIQASLDGNQLPVPGKSGQVVTLKLP